MIHKDTIKQEEELLEGYRRLGRESKRLIMTTVITAVAAESAIKKRYEVQRSVEEPPKDTESQT
jgi:predicted transcriptional regulator